MTENEHKYEVHIVGYNKTELRDLPKGFKKFVITASEVNLSEISTSEMDSFKEGVKAFRDACNWLEKQNKPILHIKFECLKGITYFKRLNDFNNIKLGSQSPKALSYSDNYFVGAFGWDVHVDGKFYSKLRDILQSKGWVFLDYVSSSGENCSTLTQHFLNKESCEKVYSDIVDYITVVGGFSGTIYWEMPVRYLVCEGI